MRNITDKKYSYIDVVRFTEWVGLNFTRGTNYWIHKFDQADGINLKTIDQLWLIYNRDVIGHI